MLLAAKRHPYKTRLPKLFWRGGGTNDQRGIMDTSKIVQHSRITDVHLMHWADGKDLFEKEFVSLPEHCKYK